ncbi:uncharacterized protein V1516DRAFT_675986 [Lipomyces oligophaga]|uniref:uncharacterized protein n=1 Tax=Lipomyces oligophaga TaxID=45792 RepID=UPI0034CE79E6
MIPMQTLLISSTRPNLLVMSSATTSSLHQKAAAPAFGPPPAVPLIDVPAQSQAQQQASAAAAAASNTSTTAGNSSSANPSDSQPRSPFPGSSAIVFSSSDLMAILHPHTQSVARDFAYPTFHPLHLSPIPSSVASEDSEYDFNSFVPSDYASSAASSVEPYSPSSFSQHITDSPNAYEDGPPWEEDPSLASPVISTAAGGEPEYVFSVASADDEIHGRAVALFDFIPENDNEVALKEGQTIWISYRHGQGWLVAQDPTTGESGLVPEEYVEIIQRDAFNPSSTVPTSGPTSESVDQLADDFKHKLNDPPISSPQTSLNDD